MASLPVYWLHQVRSSRPSDGWSEFASCPVVVAEASWPVARSTHGGSPRRLSLASGLALDVRPVEAGGASPDNARRSGLAGCDILTVTGALGATLMPLSPLLSAPPRVRTKRHKVHA